MPLLTYLNLIGLFLTTVASVIMLLSYLKVTKSVADEYIERMDKDGNYTQKKHLKDRNLGIVGFTLYLLGFIMQFVSVLLTM